MLAIPRRDRRQNGAMTQVRAVHVVVSGYVQGVGFRYHCLQEAERLGLRGWVRNLANGNVELTLEGDPEAVTRMVTWLQVGPRHADVDDVHVTDVAPAGFAGFSIQH